MADTVRYNGYTFDMTMSHVEIDAAMVPDDAYRTIKYHQYTVRVDTTIYALPGDINCGQHFKRIRQLLSKAGQELVIDHDGFGQLFVNQGSGFVQDVAFGPTPKLITWRPVGHTNAVEVVWQCEFSIPTCEGAGGVRFSGLAAFGYTINTRVDIMGYSTRTLSGYLEIAMTRFMGGSSIPDTADAYRDIVQIPQLNNFNRETTWQLSMDKRRADFSIIDVEIASPNAFPAGVVNIDARHRVGWSRRSLATLPNQIHASITLAPNQPRGRAWEIFRSIVASRTAYASGGSKVFLEALDVEESLYSHQISFSMAYRLYFSPGVSALGELFTTTGIFAPTPGDWAAYKAALLTLQTHRGRAQLTHKAADDQIVDLCNNAILPQSPSPYNDYPTPPTTPVRFCNEKPAPRESWIRFEASLTSIEENPSTAQITMGKDDLTNTNFDPTDPAATNGATDEAANIKRFIESAPAGLEFEWMGYAERVGYDIPRLGKLTIGGVTLVRVGKTIMRKKFLGTHFCQPLYGAAWKARYRVADRPTSFPTSEADPINQP